MLPRKCLLACTHMETHACTKHACISARTHAHTHTRACMHAHTHMHTHTRAHTHTLTHTHTHYGYSIRDQNNLDLKTLFNTDMPL